METLTLKFDIFHRNDKVGRIEIVDGKLVSNVKYTENPLINFMGNAKDIYSVMYGLEERVMCESRWDDVMLRHLGLEKYDAIEILKKTHGVNVDDFQWFRFDGEDIEWKDVRVRM